MNTHQHDSTLPKPNATCPAPFVAGEKLLPNEETANRMLNLMETETTCYQKMRDLLIEKKEILLANQPEQLAPIDRQLLQINRQVVLLDKERNELRHQLGFPDYQTLFMALAANISAKETRYMQQARHQLMTSTKEASQLNQEIKQLLKISFQWVQNTIETIVQAVTPEGCSSYTETGNKTSSEAKAGIMLSGSTINHSA
jgi:hypothetical protein